jgi:hypothetical protein
MCELGADTNATFNHGSPLIIINSLAAPELGRCLRSGPLVGKLVRAAVAEITLRTLFQIYPRRSDAMPMKHWHRVGKMRK